MPSVFPHAAVRASRDEVRHLPLRLHAGQLPPGLAGHVFILSTCGSVDSNGAPYPDKNDRPTVINGDGMVWRIDFAPADGGAPRISSAIVKPPDFYWDELTKNGTPLEFAGFMDTGMLRASLFLGTRNFGNTAFVPMPPPPGEAGATRLIVCYDAGPPVELDPVTLQTKGVVGTSWDPEALDGLVAFPPILATAHPFYDPSTREFFAVNYGRSGASMIETIPFLEALAFLPDIVKDVLGRLAAALGRAPAPGSIKAMVKKQVQTLFEGTRHYKQRRESALPQSFLDLVRWDGVGDIERLPVVDEATGQLAVVDESMHQVALTRRFILLLDTNFKLRLDQFYDNPLFEIGDIERLFRSMVASRQGAVSNLWVIRRDAVARAREAAQRGESRAVPAFKVRLPGAVHFLADFDDEQGIRVQCAHGNALDIAEWIRSDDKLLDGGGVRQDLHGLTTAPIDVSEVGQYLIDPVAKRVVQGQRLSDDRLWGIALYAGRGVPAWDMPPERLKHAFWFACGLWPEAYTLFIRALYAEYPERIIPIADIDRMVRTGGMPPTLVCVDLEGFAICDSYTFGPSSTLSSPQFIPDPARAGDDRGGWISTVVWTADKAWLWIFDAANLSNGPITEFEVPAELGFSLHTAWLPTLGDTPPAGLEAAMAAAPREPMFDWRTPLEDRINKLAPRAKKRLKPLVDALRKGR